MRIGVLARGLSVPIGGARNLLDEVLRWLPRLGHGHEVVSYQPSGTPVFPGVTPVWVDAFHPVTWEWYAAGKAIRRSPPDVLLAPKTLLPHGLPSGIKTVSMVLDLLYFPIRRTYLHEYKWQDVAYNRLFYRSSCRKADQLICISEQTRTDLLEVCPVPAAKTRVVPLGVTLPLDTLLAPERVEAVRQKYGLPPHYIFYAGSLSPRKNMVRGVGAWAKLAARLPQDLVVTAGKSWRDADVEQAVDRADLRPRFHRLGSVPADDLPALYAGADALFFPSLYEGFGLPVLEAMACGCPVVASNAGAIPEATGDAACLVDPFSEDEMAEGLRRVLTQSTVAEDLRQQGRARARQFSWEKTVAGILDVLEEAVGR
ncbi:MAG: glycosyltransferase family 4 protein [Verrucomicrobiota bacterium]|jgi:alpha-1,3-rhamnosyl/mannosyltransferase|nr:glycosyltransferase family 4 protein [Verrucomicrobiota bacterium]